MQSSQPPFDARTPPSLAGGANRDGQRVELVFDAVPKGGHRINDDTRHQATNWPDSAAEALDSSCQRFLIASMNSPPMFL